MKDFRNIITQARSLGIIAEKTDSNSCTRIGVGKVALGGNRGSDGTEKSSANGIAFGEDFAAADDFFFSFGRIDKLAPTVKVVCRVIVTKG